tara:strand:+ start:22379 stop:22540 length:162 start_codon:yes stop_codon:yes gene_type:complete
MVFLIKSSGIALIFGPLVKEEAWTFFVSFPTPALTGSGSKGISQPIFSTPSYL